jgi:mannose-6-phosphate isomerase-like protein (cupin superfamily)
MHPIGGSHVRRGTEGALFALRVAEVRIVISGDDTDGAFAMSQQSLQPRALAGSFHRHADESGFIFVLQGVIGAEVGGGTVRADQGDTVFVPQQTSYTFWNETDSRAEVLEIFTPAGLERWFGELAEIVASGEFDLNTIVESGRRFGTDLDLDSIQSLIDNHHLVFPS